jgi:hypothetical protein
LHAYAIPDWFGWSFLTAVCLLAAIFGRWEERVAAGAFLMDSALTRLFRDHSWIGPQWAEFWMDLGFLALLIFIALRTRRFWPLFAAGFQLLTIVTHTARMLDPKVNGWTYATAVIIWSYMIMYAILFGVWGSWKARRQLKAVAGSAGLQ